MNPLYRHAFGLYCPIYFLYKRLSERNRLTVLKKHAAAGSTAIDIGANVGFYTRTLARMVGPTGRVHAFEPDGENYKRLCRITGSAQQVTANQVAVSSGTGTLRLYTSATLNVDHQTYDIGEGRPFSEVPAVSIDDYFKHDEKIRVIKIDAQGYDMHVVLGMRKTILRSSPVLMIGELWPYGLKQAGHSAVLYVSLLRELGFQMPELDDDSLANIARNEHIKEFYTDFCAIRGES